MSRGLILQTIAKRTIKQFGELVSVYRVPSSGGAPALYGSYYCLPQPLTPTFLHQMQWEALANLAENDQTALVFPGDSGVVEGDIVVFDGFDWRISTTAADRINGVQTSIVGLVTRIENNGVSW